MSKLIGNYKLPESSIKHETIEPQKEDETKEEFEKRAMAKLGGSIAFVMKGKKVMWNG